MFDANKVGLLLKAQSIFENTGIVLFPNSGTFCLIKDIPSFAAASS